MQPAVATVVRGGKARRVPAAELVPGDVISLTAGDAVPADARVLALSTAVLRVEEASLTGESLAVHKDAEPVAAGAAKRKGSGATAPDLPIHAKTCMLFASTALVSGACTALVTATGMDTEIGAIQAQIAAAAAEEEGTPLKQKLDAFGEALARIIFWVCVAVWAINYRHFLTWQPLGKGAGPLLSHLPDVRTLSFNLGACVYYFKVAVALAVAAIPEGLPAVITTCLALGTRRMARRAAIVRRLPSVETLGCTTVICSDKTGTLTTNQMSALEVVTVAGKGGGGRSGGSGLTPHTRPVSGTAFDPVAGSVAGLDGGLARLPPTLAAAAAVCALCNDARLERGGGGSGSGGGSGGGHASAVRAVGAPTEAALLTLAEKIVAGAGGKAGASSAKAGGPRLDAALVAATAPPSSGGGGLTRLATLEFDRARKSMSVLVGRTGGSGGGASKPGVGAAMAAALPGAPGAPALLVKGAAECVLGRCTRVLTDSGADAPLDSALRSSLESTVDAMAARALRVLALAVRPGPLPAPLDKAGSGGSARSALSNPDAYEALESDLTFIGLVGLQDPPRPEVAAAVAKCRDAGMRLVVITGDNRLTAEAVCAQIGVFPGGPGAPPPAGASLSGSDFVALSPPARAALLCGPETDAAHHTHSRPPPGLCFSRAEPGQKQAIVRALRAAGDVVAMTGDGVNDAPALKLADIGIAMGIAGTEVAKSAADMVLADDNFATIVAAVGEGRAIYANMCAFIRYMISSNVGEVAAIFLAAALGLPEGLAPVQLLWVNLVTDGPPATALGFNR
jgi:P-type Ca2+ transporter type 2C